VSFSAFTNHVRNPALPHRRRVAALRSCVQLYRPIGFHATLSFLEELAGPYHHDEQALLRARDHLAASRARWHEHLREYAEERRAAKRLGRRAPRRGEANPNGAPPIWYGAARPAALHALTFWGRRRLPELVAHDDPGAREIGAVVAACVVGDGAVSVDQRHLLDTAVLRVRARIRGGLYDEDSSAYYRARDLLRVAALVMTAADPESVARTGSAVDRV
jgi:hypothetical protein